MAMTNNERFHQMLCRSPHAREIMDTLLAIAEERPPGSRREFLEREVIRLMRELSERDIDLVHRFATGIAYGGKYE